MPKFNLIQTNFTAGELSPRMLGRVDVARYNNGIKRGENVIILVHGGALGRPGTQFIANAKNNLQLARLIPFIFNTEQAYQVEMAHVSARFFTSDGAQIEASPGVPYEINTPYSAAQLAEIDFIQSADTMLLFHPDVPPQRLQRFDDDDWRIMPTPWETEPFDELGVRPVSGLVLSAITVGAGRTFTATQPVFEPSDVGRTIEAKGGIATITAYSSAQVVTGTITQQFGTINNTSGDWLITGSPQTTCTPSAVGPVGATITLTLGAAGWRTGDVGKHVVINGGLVKITGFTSTTIVNAIVRVALAATVAAEANSWALCRSMWGQEFGYPRTGSFHQQRLWVAGSPGFPQQGWFSRLGEYYNFEIGTEADAAYNFGVDSDQANQIRHLASTRAIAILTYGAEFTASGGGDPITPTTLDIQNQSAYGCGVPAPVRVGNELLFACPAEDEETGNVRDEIRSMSADRFDASNYAAPDISALAEHITEGGIVDMDAQKSLVWAVRADGQMVTCRLDRDNDVVAWTRHATDGEFESVSVIPDGAQRQVWVIVKRTINGNTRRYIERFTPRLYMDSAIRGVSGPGASVWTGLDHLEGKTVAVRADGVVQPDEVVSGGEITLGRNAFAVDIGLPFTPLVELMTAEVQSPSGSAQGLMMRTPEVTLLVKDTIGATVNGRDVNFRQFGTNVLDVPIPPFSGQKRIENLGFERGESDIIITQPQANPFHLLAVIRQLQVNG